MDCDGKDLIQPLSQLPDGSLVVSRHRADHSAQVGTLQQVRDGVPIPPGTEMVTAASRGDGSYEVTDSYVHGAAAAHGGPAQVATPDYRAGWDRVFNAPGGSA